MGRLNRIIFPLPSGFKDSYPEADSQAFFDEDLLILPIERGDYNAPNNYEKTVIEGVKSAVVDIRSDYYEPEFTTKDSRGIIREILLDLEDRGNLSTQGVSLTSEDPATELTPLVLFDEHRFDTASDRARGYTIRVGVMTVDDLKGTFRSYSGDNHGQGTRVSFTHIYNIVGSKLIDARR